MKIISEDFSENSYDRHSRWYGTIFPGKEKKERAIESLKCYHGSAHHWLQQIFFGCLDPFLMDKKCTWLTVGDAFGHDAGYILAQGVTNVTASDLNDDFLKVANELGLVKGYRKENAEDLSFGDRGLDYVLCKESYHHFPRPYMALYEMVRVARKAIIIMEPRDPISKIPALLMLSNILEKLRVGLSSRVWKNRFSYERVGNFVYKVSEREIEKFAAGLNLPMVAIKPINPNFWFEGANGVPADMKNGLFRKIRIKKGLRDFLDRFSILPSQTICAVIFKEIPDEREKGVLEKSGFRLIEIPKNPYI